MTQGKKLQQSDYFNLDWVNAEIESLTICSLELSKIVANPIKDGFFKAHFESTSKAIHNMQTATAEIVNSFNQIKDYLEEIKSNEAD